MRLLELAILLLTAASCSSAYTIDEKKLSSFSFDAVYRMSTCDQTEDMLEFKAKCTVSCQGDSVIKLDYSWEGKDSLGKPLIYNNTGFIKSGLSYLAVNSHDICYYSNEKVSVNYLFGSSPVRHILNNHTWLNPRVLEDLEENEGVGEHEDNLKVIRLQSEDEQYKQQYFEKYTFEDQMPASYTLLQISEFGDTLWEEIQYFNYEFNLTNIEEVLSPKAQDYTMISFEERYSTPKDFYSLPENVNIGEYSGQSYKGRDITIDLTLDDTTVIVEYWFIGCGPCLKQMPLLSAKVDALVNLGYKLKLYVVNSHDKPNKQSVQNLLSTLGLKEKAVFIDWNYEKEKLNVNAYPTVDVFQNGKIVKRFSGADNRAISYLDSIAKRSPS